MAQVILTQASGRLKALYGEVQGPLASIVMDRAEAFEQARIHDKIFAERKSIHSGELYTGMTAVDTFRPVGENGAHPSGGFQTAYEKFIRNVTWKGSFTISREMVDDSTVADLRKAPEAFLKDYERKRALFFAQLLAEAVKGSLGFKINGLKFSTASADEKCVFDTAHPTKVKGAAQSNKYAGAFSAENLFKAMTRMQNVRDDDGNIMALTPDTIVIPNDATVKKAVFEAIGSALDPASANNTYNVVGGQFDVLVDPYLNQFLGTGLTPWMLLDSHYNTTYDGAIRQERNELEITDKLGAHDEYIWEGYARFTGGFVDWRSLMLCGVTGGSAL